MSFSDLKKNRDKQLASLTTKLTAPNNQQQQDETYWKPTLDAAGNGSAIFRFLPAPPGEEDPYVQIFKHGFKGPGGWYMEKSLTTIGQQDPVGEVNAKLWADGDKDGARAQKRNLKYHSNIYMIKDSGNPENDGKVFKYEYGKKIFDIVKEAVSPTDEDETPFDPFDFWEGANFRLKVSQTKGTDGKTYPNYDKSKLEAPKPLFITEDGEPDDTKMEALWHTQYSLKELIDPSQFKTYDELKTRLDRVLMRNGSDARPAQDVQKASPAERFNTARATEAPKEEATSAASDDSDDDMSWFKDLENSIDE